MATRLKLIRRPTLGEPYYSEDWFTSVYYNDWTTEVICNRDAGHATMLIDSQDRVSFIVGTGAQYYWLKAVYWYYYRSGATWGKQYITDSQTLDPTSYPFMETTGALDTGGNPHAAFLTHSADGGWKLWYSKRVGTKWTTELIYTGDATSVPLYGPSMIIDKITGQPFIAVHCIYGTKMTFVVYNNGTNWVIEYIQQDGNDLQLYFATIVQGSNNKIYVGGLTVLHTIDADWRIAAIYERTGAATWDRIYYSWDWYIQSVTSLGFSFGIDKINELFYTIINAPLRAHPFYNPCGEFFGSSDGVTNWWKYPGMMPGGHMYQTIHSMQFDVPNEDVWPAVVYQDSHYSPYSPINISVAGQDHVLVETPGTFGVLGLGQLSGSPDIQIAVKEAYTPVLTSVDFTGGPRCGAPPLTVNFFDLSEEYPATWDWDFGDDTTHSTEENPTHVYADEGSYNVTLTVSRGATTLTKTRMAYIYVTNNPVPPDVQFNCVPTSGVEPLMVSFADVTDQGLDNRIWGFGDGTIIENGLETEQHTYDTPGTYTVWLEGTGPCGIGRETKMRHITVGRVVGPPVADFVAQPSYGKMPLQVTFLDTSLNDPTAWLWSFGDGNISVLKSPTHVYGLPGEYDVSLRVTNSLGNDTKSVVGAVTVTEVPLYAYFTSPIRTGFEPLMVSFVDKSYSSANTIASWEWDFGDGSEVSRAPNPAHEYVEPGTYPVSLTVTDSRGNVASTSKVGYVTVKPRKPVALFHVNHTSGTAPLTVSFTDDSTGNPDTWIWYFGDGAMQFIRNPTHVYTTPGKYRVRLVVRRSSTRDTSDIFNLIEVN